MCDKNCFFARWLPKICEIENLSWCSVSYLSASFQSYKTRECFFALVSQWKCSNWKFYLRGFSGEVKPQQYGRRWQRCHYPTMSLYNLEQSVQALKNTVAQIRSAKRRLQQGQGCLSFYSTNAYKLKKLSDMKDSQIFKILATTKQKWLLSHIS